MRSDLYDITVQLKHETPKAILVTDGVTEDWLAKDLIEYVPHTSRRGWYEVTAPEWLLKEKGFI